MNFCVIITMITFLPCWKIDNNPELIFPADSNQKSRMIQELKKLKAAFDAKDKRRIADFFSFPIADSSLSFSRIESSLDEDINKNGGLVTRKIFEKHFTRIFEYFNMQEFSNLFKNLNIDILVNKNELHKERHLRNSGCYFNYSIAIEANEISVGFGTNSDENYWKKHPDAEIICEEYFSNWVFIFTNDHLVFNRMLFAG
jgi:hypothetical protein